MQLPPQTEAAFLRQVVELARLQGFLVAHFRPARTRDGWRTAVAADGAGYPDLTLVNPRTGRLIVAELKVGRRRLTPAQAVWIDAFRAASVEAYIWTPADIDAIVHALSPLESPHGRRQQTQTP